MMRVCMFCGTTVKDDRFECGKCRKPKKPAKPPRGKIFKATEKRILSHGVAGWTDVWTEAFVAGEKLTAFGKLRARGFPGYDLTLKEQAKEIVALLKYGPAKITDGKIEQTMHALGTCWSYFPHAWDVRCGDAKTPREVFDDDEMLLNVIDKRIRHGSVGSVTDSEVRKQLKSVTGAQGVSNFRPTAAWAIYDKYCPEHGTVLDMSCGFGGRLMGATCCVKIDRYVGCDPGSETFAGLERFRDALAKILPGRGLLVKLHPIGSEDLILPANSVDVAFTSPPYMEDGIVEAYADEPTQSHVKFPTPEAWFDGFLGQTMRNVHQALKPEGIMALNISARMEATVEQQALKNGFVLVERLRLRLSQIMGAKHKGEWKTEPVLVFKRK